MVFNRFSIFLIIRLFLILVNLIGISAIYNRSDLVYTTLFLCLLVVAQVYFLINYINVTNRELTKFVLAVQDSDNTAKFPDMAGSFNDLFRSFEKILDTLKSFEVRQEAQSQFIQHIINKIDIGIVAMSSNQKVVLSNRSANHIREMYTFGSGKTFLDTLVSVEQTKIEKANSSTWGAKELMISNTSLKLLDEDYSVFTIKDIKSQLETKELESWQKLIRILAHEIMNSVTPIASLSETTLSIIESTKQKDQLSLNNLQKIERGAKTIKSRSENLLEFLDDYRQLIKIPKPKPESVNFENLLMEMKELFKSELEKNNIILQTTIEANIVYADRIQLEQILINLITNAIQALDKNDQKEIQIFSTKTNGYSLVSVSDNGSGIEPNKLEKIFVPFFTTKTKGSGIGLSLSRQIANLHHGTLDVESINGRTEFILRLPLNREV